MNCCEFRSCCEIAVASHLNVLETVEGPSSHDREICRYLQRYDSELFRDHSSFEKLTFFTTMNYFEKSSRDLQENLYLKTLAFH